YRLILNLAQHEHALGRHVADQGLDVVTLAITPVVAKGLRCPVIQFQDEGVAFSARDVMEICEAFCLLLASYLMLVWRRLSGRRSRRHLLLRILLNGSRRTI